MYCGQGSVVKRHTNGSAEAKVLRCRSWTCPDCQPRRRGGLVSDAMAGQPNTFITLTLPATYAKRPAEGAALLADAWRLIRKRAMRVYRLKALPFLAVVELTEKGTPHLHILCRVAWLNQRWLSDQMKELADAPIVDIRRADKHRKLIRYVSKYVGKEPARVGQTKRYWSSRDFDLRPGGRPQAASPPGTQVEASTRPWWRWQMLWASRGLEVIELAPGWVLAFSAFETARRKRKEPP